MTWQEGLAVLAGLVLVVYRTGLVLEAVRDWRVVVRRGIGNGRRVLARGHLHEAPWRLLADVVLLLLLGYLAWPDSAQRRAWGHVALLLLPLVPVCLALAAAVEADTRRRLDRHLRSHE